MKRRWPDEESRRLFKDLQSRLRERIVLEGPHTKPDTLLAIDVSYRGGHAFVGAVTWSIKKACPLKVFLLRVNAYAPYITGMFFLRELPPIVTIVRTFSIDFDILLLNASGIAHPQGVGLASHAGLYFKKPSIGVTEKVPFGSYENPDIRRGDYKPLFDGEKNIIGYVYRPQDFLKPIFITPGHLVSPENAFSIIRDLPYTSRFPEPLRIADVYSRKNFEKEIKEWCS